MAWKYIEKHKPFLINNLEKQQLLWDRTVVYDILEKIKVPIANHFYALHDETYIDDIENKRFGNIIPHPIGKSIS
jgi:inositol hexakisphosphate/diphosphoinositol-pentakisphosphate kinase